MELLSDAHQSSEDDATNNQPNPSAASLLRCFVCHKISKWPNVQSSATATGGQASNGIMMIEFSCLGQN
jgi:hypothetical protein